MNDQCRGTTRDGAPCAARPRPERGWCAWHDPDLADRRDAWNRSGGRAKSNVVRAQKRLPQDLRDTLEALYRVMAAVEAGDMEPSRASAIAQVSRAIVAVFETATVEARIAEIEAKVAARAAS